MDLSLGVVGAGHMGARHVRVAHSLGVLAAVFDTDPSKREIACQYGAEFHPDYFEFTGDLDAVIISTPPESHFRIAMEAISRGISVLVEKPLTLDPAQGEVLVRAAEEAEVSLAVGHVERFNPAYMRLKELVERPEYVFTDRASPLPARPLGPALFDIGVHDIDLSMDLIGAVPIALHSTLSANGEMGLIRFRFEDGEATVRFNRASEVKVREVTVTKGGQVVCADIMNQAVYTTDGELVRFEGAMEPIEAEIRDFLDSLEHRQPTVCGQLGLRAVKIAHLVQRGSGRGWIDIEAL